MNTIKRNTTSHSPLRPFSRQPSVGNMHSLTVEAEAEEQEKELGTENNEEKENAV